MPGTTDEDLAAACGTAFAAGDTKGAVQQLQAVLQQWDNDPKVVHNLAIAEYVDGGMREPRKLLAALEGLKQRLEDARSESEFGESDAATLGDTDPSLTAYNMAVLHYQLKQYARCRSLLEDMYANIEPIDEFLAFKLCFLLIDVYTIGRQVEPACEVLAYLEKSFAALTKTDGAAKENGVAAADGTAAGGGGDGVAPGSADGAKGAAAAAGEWPNKRSSRRPPTDISAEEVRSLLCMYKAKLALMSLSSSKSSKREVKTTLNACAQNTTGLFLKCNLEWQRQNYRKAIKLLNNSCQSNERDVSVPALYFNNLGCIHHSMRRHQAAAFYFSRALQENAQLYSGEQNGTISLPQFSCDRRCELEYNRALQLLLSGRPEAAFDSFLVALQLMHSQPRIWLRLSEACVAHHVQQQADAERTAGTAAVSPLVETVAKGSRRGLACGPTPHSSCNRFLVLPTNGPANAGREGVGAVEAVMAADGGGGGGNAARATLYTNLAVVHILQGGVKQAESYVQQALTLQPDCRQTILCAVYLEIHAGRMDGALDLLKKQRLRPKS